LPDENSVLAANKVKTLLNDLQESDLVIVLISGGASALLTDVPSGTTLQLLKDISDRLIKSGAAIAEINTVRKHLSELKGGGLAKLVFPAKLYAIVLSDVVGNNPDVIGSGLTVPDTSTVAEAVATMKQYQLDNYRHLIKETPKPGDDLFHNSHYLLAATNEFALQAAKDEAERLGYHTSIINSAVSGLVSDLSQELVRQAVHYTGTLPACLLMGGECTIQVTGNGKGGRNQQFALQAGIALKEHPHITVLSGGTDGTDGPTDAAGAMANAGIMNEAAVLGKDAEVGLADNDAYHFFENTSGHIRTGPTQTNVMDIMIALIAK
jgi:hydroxypyruvate reductase